MFSKELRDFVEERLKERGKLSLGIEKKLEWMEGLSLEKSLLMKFLYAVMPLRDMAEYEPEVFLDYVEHSLWLYENVEWCKKLPEDLFLNHVLYYRINTENIVKNRKFFYDLIKDRIAHKNLYEAVIELNYFCAESLTYQSTDRRTMSPIASYYSGYGRCGEESTYAVTVFRSAGIPARQVYTPWWAHCDDNHAWVEVFVDGKWQYLGACEPEEVLNRGWFTAASGRAMMVHSRVFSEYQCSDEEECMGVDGCLSFYNNTPLYAPVRRLFVKVTKEGKDAEGVRLAFEILNMAQFGKISTLTTDEKGEASLYLGRGSVLIRAEEGDYYGECFVNEDEEKVEISLCKWDEKFLLTNSSVEFDFMAPVDSLEKSSMLTKDEKKRGKEKRKAAHKLREERIKGYFDVERAKEFPEAEDFFFAAKGNFDEVYKFLSKDENPYRLKLLKTLSQKDFIDLKAEVLEDHLMVKEEGIPEEIFVEYVLAPRLYYEELTAYKSFIRTYFSEEEKQAFQKKPLLIWDFIEKNIRYFREKDYISITSTPVGCLKKMEGNELSKKQLFVAICRAICIPAAINKVTVEPEYFCDGDFRSVKAMMKQLQEKDTVSMDEDFSEKKPYGILRLQVKDGTKWNYYNAYTIGKLEEKSFVTLDYDSLKFENNELKLSLEEGIYRLLVTARMPNGNQRAAYRVFRIEAESEVILRPELKEPDLSDMLVSNELPDFEVKDEAGKTMDMSLIVGKETSIIAFLEEGAEPTEHVLNEVLERLVPLRNFAGRLIFVVNDKASLQNPTLAKVLKEIPKIQLYFDEDMENAEPIARRMYVNPEKLPLLVLTREGMTGVYACSGYNVGSVDLILKMID